MSLLHIFWSMLWFFLFVIWIWLLITIFSDLFRSEMSGLAKALWTLFIIVFPFLGVLIYLIVNGDDMQRRAMAHAAQVEQAQRAYIQEVAGSSIAEELAKLAELHDQGKLTDEEYERLKAKLIAT